MCMLSLLRTILIIRVVIPTVPTHGVHVSTCPLCEGGTLESLLCKVYGRMLDLHTADPGVLHYTRMCLDISVNKLAAKFTQSD